MIASEHYKDPSPAVKAKLESVLKDAEDHLTRKSDELVSRMWRIAQLPDAEKVLERVSPAIKVAWLSDGDLQKWAEVVEPAVKTYFGAIDAKTKQKVQTDGFDSR